MPRTTGSDELFKLIHSLTINEKGSFKKFAIRHTSEGNRYLQLFEAINKQTAFEEESLKKKFKELAELKNYLKEMILQCLSLSDLGGNLHQVIDKNTVFARILISKGLGKAAQKLIQQSIEIADRNEFFEKKLTLLSSLNTLQIREVPPNEKWDFINSCYQKEVECEAQRSELTVLLFEQQKTFFLVEERSTGRPYAHLIQKINLAALETAKPSLSNRSQMVRLSTLGAYYDLTNQPEKGFKTLSENLTFARKIYKQDSNSNNTTQYSRALINYITIAIAANHLKEGKVELANLLGLNTGNATVNTHNLFQYVHLMQELAFKEQKFEAGAKETLHYLSSGPVKEKMANHLAIGFSFYKNLALLQLLAKNYQQVYITIQDIFKINKAVNSAKTELDTWLLNILLQIEMGNYELLPSLLSSAKRAIKKNKSDKTFEQIILLLAKYKGDTRFFNAYAADTAYDYMLYEKLNFRNWMQAIAKKIPLQEVARF